MNVRIALTAFPTAAALLLSSAGPVGAQSLPPMFAAQLNAGTAYSGLGRTGQVGLGISAVIPDGAGLMAVEVAGVQAAFADEPGPQTISTMGSPQQAALLNAGTAWTGIGRFGVVGTGIAGPLPVFDDQARADLLTGYGAE
ncbi:MAG TPA: hypothetical protein VFX49_22725 [Chloroflexota bacterium]|nr:hypothetical protein [Chloroflexota bacterium]